MSVQYVHMLYVHVDTYVYMYVHANKCIKRRRVLDVNTYTRICNNMGMYASRPLTHSPTHTHTYICTYICAIVCLYALTPWSWTRWANDWFVQPWTSLWSALTLRPATHKHTRTPTQQRQRRLCCCCGCCSCVCKNRTFCVRLWLWVRACVWLRGRIRILFCGCISVWSRCRLLLFFCSLCNLDSRMRSWLTTWIRMYICTCTCMYVCVSVCEHDNACIYVCNAPPCMSLLHKLNYGGMYICTNACMHVFMSVTAYVCKQLCMHAKLM